jgi:hypothetical protein
VAGHYRQRIIALFFSVAMDGAKKHLVTQNSQSAAATVQSNTQCYLENHVQIAIRVGAGFARPRYYSPVLLPPFITAEYKGIS